MPHRQEFDSEALKAIARLRRLAVKRAALAGLPLRHVEEYADSFVVHMITPAPLQKWRDAQFKMSYAWRCATVALADYREKTSPTELHETSLEANLDLYAGEPSSEPDPLDRLLRKQQRLRLEKALAELTPRKRLAVRMRFADGRSYADIAQVIGATVDGTRKLISRALLQLRSALLDTEDGDP